MANILHIKTSISGENSVSNQLSQIVIDQLLKKNPDTSITVRDLAVHPIPHLELQHFQSFSIANEERNEEEREASKYSEEALQEIHEADSIVIGIPFYNFSFPSTLKSWIDHISIAGKTFSFADGTPKGLLQNKKVYLNLAIGGVYDNGLIENMESYLRTLFGFIGITDVEVFKSQGTMIPQLKEVNYSKAVSEIEDRLA